MAWFLHCVPNWLLSRSFDLYYHRAPNWLLSRPFHLILSLCTQITPFKTNLMYFYHCVPNWLLSRPCDLIFALCTQLTPFKTIHAITHIYIFKIRTFEKWRVGVAECRWGMGRDSGKCLHELDMLWVCGQPHISVVVRDGEQLQCFTQQRFVYIQRCRGSISATPLRSQIIAALLKSHCVPGRRLLHSCVTALCIAQVGH